MFLKKNKGFTPSPIRRKTSVLGITERKNKSKVTHNSRKLVKGFTLIELLVVIAIIGILAILIFLAMQRAQASARDAQRKAIARDIATAEAINYDATKNYAEPSVLKNKDYFGQDPVVCPDGSNSSCPAGNIIGKWDDATVPNNSVSPKTFTVTVTLEVDKTKGFECSEKGCKDTP